MQQAQVYVGDLPHDHTLKGSIAIDTETMGLHVQRDRLCLIQMCDEAGQVAMVRFPVGGDYQAPVLQKLLCDSSREKIFHFARFDVAMIYRWLGVWCEPVFCTKIASKLVRTYTSRHGLKDLCHELLAVELSKQAQSSDWGSETLSAVQLTYAASDVLHLHALKAKLEVMLEREGRSALARQLFLALKPRAHLDLLGWDQEDIFAH
jgi:ribonuclease D